MIVDLKIKDDNDTINDSVIFTNNIKTINFIFADVIMKKMQIN